MGGIMFSTEERHMRKSTILTLAFVLLGGGILTACGSQSSSPSEANAAQTIRIGFQTGNTLNVLKESGYLEERIEEEGLDVSVEWIEFDQGTAVMEALSTNNIDYGNAADGPGIFAQAQGRDIVYVGASLPHEQGVGIMVKSDSGIETVADLKGKSIAAMKGGNHHYLAILALEAEGLSADDVDFRYMGDASQGRSALETGEVDALASWDPFFAGVEHTLDVKTLDHNVEGYPNRTFYFSTPQFAEESPELIQILLEETNRSDQWANENPDEVAELLSNMIGIEKEILDTVVNRRDYGVENINEDIIAAQQKQADDYYRIGLIENEVDVSEIMPVDAAWATDNIE
ncbi:aliphatic sulfonate ABC transporter substrate-binding protein [Alkalihalobacillus clausii]|nr:aliphatic sulfonate ABC transporter substrate-binding protein [Shouchella clausii]MBU3263844.1 aliphatic sulfonate ABC transporter substrate-binding protein [Shouchella clausii]MBU3508194.1 aliphatic sulfonate ABC transporter substrate-binding protein [Shouchella clausii]MBU3535417.1 aliphatic sulfonate ABC transporter substrate-binding protein [Shouchella clausii]MBX0308572.1 aliphatic sulfonate ABC transporter substrate-binding protein [Shouchella clausii]